MIPMGKTWDRLMGRREIIAYLVIGGFVIGFFLGKIQSNEFVPVVAAIISFYFGQRANIVKKQ